MIELDYSRFVLALMIVVGLIGIFAFVLRRIGFGNIRTSSSSRQQRRLTIQEVASIDARRKLVLVRRDDTEHLVLLGLSQDLLIESGIPVSDSDKTITKNIKRDSAFKRVITDVLSKTK
tara:strand:+ start:2081 stop:2437 length:357 start_codon:yes stop_codon:yes gene_type:complete